MVLGGKMLKTYWYYRYLFYAIFYNLLAESVRHMQPVDSSGQFMVCVDVLIRYAFLLWFSFSGIYYFWVFLKTRRM